MATKYFGLCDEDTGAITGDDGETSTTEAVAWWDGTKTWTCPGTGSVTLTALELYCKLLDGNGGDFRLGLYDAAGTTLVYEGAATFNPASSSYQWCGHTGLSVALTGGASYRFIGTRSTGSGYVGYFRKATGKTSGDAEWNDQYYAAFPATIPSGTADTSWAAWRATIDTGATAQFARPAADRADGTWTNEASSQVNLYASIDEETANDADYIRSAAAPTNDTCTVDLSAISTPVAGTVTMRIRARFL